MLLVSPLLNHSNKPWLASKPCVTQFHSISDMTSITRCIWTKVAGMKSTIWQCWKWVTSSYEWQCIHSSIGPEWQRWHSPRTWDTVWWSGAALGCRWWRTGCPRDDPAATAWCWAWTGSWGTGARPPARWGSAGWSRSGPTLRWQSGALSDHGVLQTNKKG